MTENNGAGGKIQFIENHVPALRTGDYTLTVTQTITAGDKIKDEKPVAATLQFSVLGPRFSLDPQVIESVFPPEGSLGDHSNVLPHIVLNRSTLPWERQAPRAEKSDSSELEEKKKKLEEKKKKVPWLALLLFEEGELAKTSSASPKENRESFSLKELKNSSTGEIKWPGITLESGQHDDDLLSVIDVPWKILRKIIPGGKDLQLLTHVRRTEDVTGKPGEDALAVIICNRLPRPGGVSTVHLVSLEGRYKQGGDLTDPTFVFDEQGAQENDKIRLVSLKSWRFACIDSRQSFKGLLMHLNHQVLFNIQNQTTPPAEVTISNDLNKGQIPDSLRQAFTQSKHPIEATVVVDHSQWKITDKTKNYIISNTLNVYNQAGRWLFKLKNITLPRPEKSQQVPETLKTIFGEKNHILSEGATIVNSGQDHWWINTDQYLVAQETGRLYVYHLDPDSASTLRLPELKSDDRDIKDAAEQYLKMGCVPLPHAMRQGNKTVSWYHGPLVPGSNTTSLEDLPVPIRSADALVRYNRTYGMFDVSYAAAWELGRLLALQSKSFSVSLYNWKRALVQQIQGDAILRDANIQVDHLPFDGPSATFDFPQAVRSWFEQLALLEGVPFNYLVPDERLLPPESIRFFQVDPMWMECLMDGAFSIGRVLASHQKHDTKRYLFDLDSSVQASLAEKNIRALQEAFAGKGATISPSSYIEKVSETIWHIADNENPKYYHLQIEDQTLKVYQAYPLPSPEPASGFLLRSDVVAGWPGLQVDGYDEIPPDPTPEKEFWFQLQLRFTVDLMNKTISPDLQREFQQEFRKRFPDKQEILLSIQKSTVENRQWSIMDNMGRLQYSLSKRENNELDVCSAADSRFLFSIDASLEMDLSTGRISTDLQRAFQEQKQTLPPHSTVSVTGWFVSDNEYQKHYWFQIEGQGLKVYRGYKLPLLRMSRLSTNILLCLFDGIVQAVDIHLKPESMHFGFDSADGVEQRDYYKKLRDSQDSTPKKVPWRKDEKTQQEVWGVVDIARFASDDMQVSSAADFAVRMIEGVQKVRFVGKSVEEV